MESISHQFTESGWPISSPASSATPTAENVPLVTTGSRSAPTPEGSGCRPTVPAGNPATTPAEKCRGGPQTLEGKTASCRNALKHGLSANELLPDILEVDLVQQYYEALWEEWRPDTPTQDFLVRDTARHQAALERAEQIELAVLRRGARKPLNMPLNVGHGGEMVDAILAAAGTSDAIERISRYRRQHERALLRNLTALREAKTMVLPAPMRAIPSSRQAFSSEEECEKYLIGRVKNAAFHCPGCNGQRGKWLASRRLWQCCACRRQVGIRAGTVMEGSRIGLLAWFRAIDLLSNNPKTSTAEVMAATGVSRKGTIRKMVGRIGQAMASPAASHRLAGLDVMFHSSGQDPAEIRVREKFFLQNELTSGDQRNNEGIHHKNQQDR